MTLYVSSTAPHLWARVTKPGKIQARGEADSLDLVPVSRRDTRVVAVLPGERVVARQVSVPSKQRRKVETAIPYALEESLSADIDSVHIAIFGWQPGHPASVGIVGRGYLEEVIAEFRAAGLALDAAVADYSLLPSHPQSRFTVAVRPDGRISIREGRFTGITVDNADFDLWWETFEDKAASVAVNQQELARRMVEADGISVSQWDIGDDFVHWLENHPKQLPEANLLTGPYTPEHLRKSNKGYKIAASLAALAIALKLAFMGYETYSLEKSNRKLDQRIESLFRKNFPDIKRIVNPRAQMEEQINTLVTNRVTGGGLEVYLNAVARAVPPTGAEIQEITFRDDTLLVSCSTSNFAGLDQLKKQFEADPSIRAELISSGSLENRVTGRFRLSFGS